MKLQHQILPNNKLDNGLYTIVSGNKPSTVALYQNHAIVFIEMLFIKCQIFVLNLNMPKTKRDGAEEPTIKIDSRKF